MSDRIIVTDSWFSAHESAVIAAIANAVITADDRYGVPGGGDAPILAKVLARIEPHQVRMRSEIEQLCVDCDPLAMTSDGLLELLEGDGRYRSFYRLLSVYIVQAYYQDSRVLDSLGLPDRAPFPDGYAVAEGDWSLLDQVKTRRPFYRPVGDT